MLNKKKKNYLIQSNSIKINKEKLFYVKKLENFEYRLFRKKW